MAKRVHAEWQKCNPDQNVPVDLDQTATGSTLFAQGLSVTIIRTFVLPGEKFLWSAHVFCSKTFQLFVNF